VTQTEVVFWDSSRLQPRYGSLSSAPQTSPVGPMRPVPPLHRSFHAELREVPMELSEQADKHLVHSYELAPPIWQLWSDSARPRPSVTPSSLKQGGGRGLWPPVCIMSRRVVDLDSPTKGRCPGRSSTSLGTRCRAPSRAGSSNCFNGWTSLRGSPHSTTVKKNPLMKTVV
jgi:hypothetical protein